MEYTFWNTCKAQIKLLPQKNSQLFLPLYYLKFCRVSSLNSLVWGEMMTALEVKEAPPDFLFRLTRVCALLPFERNPYMTFPARKKNFAKSRQIFTLHPITHLLVRSQRHHTFTRTGIGPSHTYSHAPSAITLLLVLFRNE